MAKIIVVDDDPTVLDELENLLGAENFTDAHFFELPSLALDFLSENKPDLIISDFEMPEIDGVKFLAMTRVIHPSARRILHSSYAGRSDLIRAINEAGISGYIEKKWDGEARLWDFGQLLELITSYD